MAEKKKATTKKTASKKEDTKKVAPVKQEVKKQAPQPHRQQSPRQHPRQQSPQLHHGSRQHHQAGDARVGVFICHCGTNIAGSMDIEAVQEASKAIPHVAYVDNYKYMCSMPGQTVIQKAIKDHKLTGIVVAACTPRLHEPTFRTGNQGWRPEPVPVRDGKHP